MPKVATQIALWGIGLYLLAVDCIRGGSGINKKEMVEWEDRGFQNRAYTHWHPLLVLRTVYPVF